jgi:transposase
VLLVDLDDPDENIFDQIIAYRHRSQTSLTNASISHNSAVVKPAATFISEHGETVVREMRQEQNRQIECDAAEIVLAYQRGASTNKLARQYGCHRHTISNLLKKNGVEVSQSKIKSEETVRQIIALYEQNHIIEEISEQFGVSQSCINRLLHAHGVSVRGRWDY